MRNNYLNYFSTSGLGATFIGNGIGRFAYITLMPALIQLGWFTKSEASYLGVATLFGYIFGALSANLLLKYMHYRYLIRISMLICSLSYLFCAAETFSIYWFYFWRTMAGVGGAMLMVLAPPIIMRNHNPSIRARVSGIVFSGIGLGAMLSGILIPFLIMYDLSAAWVGMGSISLLFTIYTWRAWGDGSSTDTEKKKEKESELTPLTSPEFFTIGLILMAYTLNAIGYLPHTLFWVDFIVRELGMSLSSGGIFWAIFGIGATIGPLVTGYMGDVFGLKRSLILSFGLKAFGVALPLLDTSVASLTVSSFLVGAFTPGVVTLISTYTLECVGVSRHTKAWSMMTLSFAISQAVVGYIMAFVIADFSTYLPLFLISSLALLVSMILIVATNTRKNLLYQDNTEGDEHVIIPK
ncbi:MFS transporter [Endozoicomonas sp. (ex Bugula neritina AB1)]|nr:MFS transporter [Endozoicomonas sp. (ex Bugula neritina AB1)]